jgi:hypothetical protein
MKINSSPKKALRSLAILLMACTLVAAVMSRPLHAGLWDQIKERVFLTRLTGGGEFVGYQRNVDTKDPAFPIEAVNDGFKMIRVYEDFPGSYMVEWTWRVLLKNKSSRAVEITFEYKLQDEDALLVATSKEFFKKIAAGETVTIEKTDYLPYETARRVMNSNWYIHLQNLQN